MMTRQHGTKARVRKKKLGEEKKLAEQRINNAKGFLRPRPGEMSMFEESLVERERARMRDK